MRETTETTVLLDLPSLPSAGGLLDLPLPRRLRPAAPVRIPRSGGAQPEAAPATDIELAQRAATTARIERRLDALLEIAGPSFAAFAASFDFGRHRSLADIGGTTGLLSCLVAERHPQIACRSYDMEIVRPIAERRIRERGLAGRVRAETIDFLADAFPVADIITMGVILHDWNVQRQKMLIAKAYRALPAGGAMVAIECLDDEARNRKSCGVSTSEGRTIEFGDAFDLTGDQFAQWCIEAGFSRSAVLPLTGAAGATIAYK
jgi:hypothetical protein